MRAHQHGRPRRLLAARPPLRPHAASVGENLAWMRGCNASAIVQMWMNSAPHRHVMLSKLVPPHRRRPSAARAKCFVTADFASAASRGLIPPTRRSARVSSAMRRAFEHPLAPALGCALVCLVYLLAQPATADMAAHSYRAWLFEHEGLTVWNAQWYGGHHVLGLLAAVRAAGRRDRAGARRRAAPRSPRSRSSPRSRARRRRRPPRARRRLAVHGRRAVQRRDRADAVPARHRARRSAAWSAGARPRRVLSRRARRCARCSPARSRACS